MIKILNGNNQEGSELLNEIIDNLNDELASGFWSYFYSTKLAKLAKIRESIKAEEIPEEPEAAAKIPEEPEAAQIKI